MKLCFFLCTVAFLQISAAAIAQKITLNKSNASLRETLNEIRQQSGYSILYDPDVLSTAKNVNVSLRNVSLEEALKQCFKGQPFSYEISAATIIITPQPLVNNQATQAVKITGVVTDNKNQPLPGVSVKVKNAPIGAVTDLKGAYSLTVPDGTAVLVFSFIGYSPQEVIVGQRKIINVILMEMTTNLDALVVVGYGTQKKKDLTGSVGTVNMEDFSKAPVKSFDEALAGRVAGVQVSGNDGQPGSLNNVVIRGNNSITQGNSPLYVIDGFPIENPDNNTISPSDIASIDVLKDASATAIYGARGANGVIIITTKRGTQSKPVINLNSYYGLQKNARIMELMSPYDFVKYQLELLPDPVNGAAKLYLRGDTTLDFYRNVAPIDLQNEVLRTAPMQNYDLSMRGGNDQTQYSFSGNLFDQKGVVINSGYKRLQGRITLDQRINPKLKVGLNVNYANSSNYGTQISAGVGTASVFYSAWGYRPTTGIAEYPLDELLFDPSIDYNAIVDYRVNPVIDLNNQLIKSKNSNFLANGYAEYNIIKNLVLRVTGGITIGTVLNQRFFNSQTQAGNPRNQNGVNGSIYNSPSETWLNENTLTYTKVFKKYHNFNVLGGFTSQGNTNSTSGFSASQVFNESLGINGLVGAPTQIGTANSSRWTMSSFLGRVNYNYKSRYLLTASFRADGSSRFPVENKWGYFPSGSIAWRMSEEKFIKKFTFVSDAKLRFSYGATGNNRVSDYASYSQLGFNSVYSYNNGTPSPGAQLTALGNTKLKWETTTQANLGYDLSLFKNNISLVVDVYSKTTSDLLLNANLPYTTGLDNGFKNIGKMGNKGLEFTLNTVNVKNKNFTWNSSFNISFNKNKVLELTQNQNSMTTLTGFNINYFNIPGYISVLGQPVGQMYGLVWEGNYQFNDFDRLPDGRHTLKPEVPTNGNPRNVIKPGDIKYKDINGDGLISALDNTVIGRGLPIHTGGFSNNFIYKGFDLNVFFQWSYGNDILNANRYIFAGNAQLTPYLNQYAEYADRWQPDNPSNTLFRTGGQGPYNYSSRVIEDGSFLRLKTVALGYNFPAKLLTAARVKTIRVYASAQNLYTWTNYSGIDPEVSTRNSALTPGFDYSAYPRARTITFGANILF